MTLGDQLRVTEPTTDNMLTFDQLIKSQHEVLG
jgi:hypothetical protein